MSSVLRSCHISVRAVSARSASVTISHMERTELLQEMLVATSPHETSTAISDARDWLLDHPTDQVVISAMEDLIEVEREALGAF
jgi:hypothetical protein